MAAMDGPFTAEFVALCVEQPLKHAPEFRAGEWLTEPEFSIFRRGQHKVTGKESDMTWDEPWVWLPRLDQLVDLLAEAGIPEPVLGWHDLENGRRLYSYQLLDDPGFWTSREEAMYRMLLRVRSLTSAPGRPRRLLP